MTWIPFLCLFTGFIFGLQDLHEKVRKAFDFTVNAALVVLMLVIGLSIGSNDSVMQDLPIIGIKCAFISLAAIFFSVAFTLFMEKTLLPLDALKNYLFSRGIGLDDKTVDPSEEADGKKSILLWIIPLCILSGVLLGYLFWPSGLESMISLFLTASLIVLYFGVGVSLGTNKKVFFSIKILGLKVLFLPAAIFAGSAAAGFLSALLLNLPFSTAVLSACGMSYYSITGAYMTQVSGIEAGAYGFLVNVMREFFTVLLLPVLVKISKGSPIAGGASGNMDTMLVPVTKFVGIELSLVALITGVILTLAVPVLLPLLFTLLV